MWAFEDEQFLRPPAIVVVQGIAAQGGTAVVALTITTSSVIQPEEFSTCKRYQVSAVGVTVGDRVAFEKAALQGPVAPVVLEDHS